MEERMATHIARQRGQVKQHLGLRPSLHPIISGLMKWFFSDTMTDRSPVMHAMTDVGTAQSDQPFSGRPPGGQGAGGLPETNTIHCHTQLDLSWIYHGTSHPNIPEIIFLMLNSCIF